MPIFHDPHEDLPWRPSSRQAPSPGRQTAQLPTFGAERPLMDGEQPREPGESNTSLNIDPESPKEDRKLSLLGRFELIERIKRTNSPTWLQRQGNRSHLDQSSGPRPTSRDRPKTPLPFSAGRKPSHASTSEQCTDPADAGLAIERPRSALHSGDFREKKEVVELESGSSSSQLLTTSPVAHWNRSFPVAAFPSYRNESPYSFDGSRHSDTCAVTRARAISQSAFNSYAFLPPTSPLVQQANNTDLDFSSRPGSRQGSTSPERSSRRHTYTPASYHDYQATQMARSMFGTPGARHLRHGGSTPYQAHQPRRSLTLNQLQPNPNLQTPFVESRRPSFSTEATPLHHAPMVGSYEESILRGRMSTTPSRPLNFVAKIGVLGKGQCKSSLKCPPHVTVPFPAVFYSYNTGNGRISDNEPSPYVGLIDLENSLAPPAESAEPSRRKRRRAEPTSGYDDLKFRLQLDSDEVVQSVKEDTRRREKERRRSSSPKAPSGGCYRIPSQGQLQIVLKNPNKTAVKLFLVPYDISDMIPGQKTFIRQRSYSAGPIIDMPASSRSNLGTDRPEAALSTSDDPNDRPILRYLIHLHLCCPAKGRYYLYKSIRVVFANRVPDGKEKLRNEIQLPEPRYSAYKPIRESIALQNTSLVAMQLTSATSSHRQGVGWALFPSQHTYDQMDGLQRHPTLPPPAIQFTGGSLSSSTSHSFSEPLPDLKPIPFSLTRLAAIEPRPVFRDHVDGDTRNPSRTPVVSPKSAVDSPTIHGDGAFEKLSRGDVGYGGNVFPSISNATIIPSAGLLSQRLRGLEVESDGT